MDRHSDIRIKRYITWPNTRTKYAVLYLHSAKSGWMEMTVV